MKVYFDNVPSKKVEFCSPNQIVCMGPLPYDFRILSGTRARKNSFVDEGYAEYPSVASISFTQPTQDYSGNTDKAWSSINVTG